MKKIISLLIVFACLSGLFMGFSASANAENINYKEYYTYIKGRLDSVGYYGYKEYASERSGYTPNLPSSGLLYAKLIDFDGNGVYELVTVETRMTNIFGGSNSDYDIEETFYKVHTLKNNKITEIATEVIPHWPYLHNGFGFCRDSKNKFYLIIVDEDQNCEYRSYTNGQWIKNSATWDNVGGIGGYRWAPLLLVYN